MSQPTLTPLQEGALVALVEAELDNQNAAGLERSALGHFLLGFALRAIAAVTATSPEAAEAFAQLVERATLADPNNPTDYAAAEKMEALGLGALNADGTITLTPKGEATLNELRAAYAAEIRAMADRK